MKIEMSDGVLTALLLKRSRAETTLLPNFFVNVSLSFCICNDLHLTEFRRHLQPLQDRRRPIAHEKLLPKVWSYLS